MAKEIERKFLVMDKSFTKMANSVSLIKQAYISTNPDSTVRVRIRGEQGFITVKGRNQGAVRNEWEYPIPAADAEEMAAALAGGWSIEKERHLVDFEGFTWEVDEFHGRHEGLIVAEVEMPSANCQPALPPFIGEEVTGDPRYYNSTLAQN